MPFALFGYSLFPDRPPKFYIKRYLLYSQNILFTRLHKRCVVLHNKCVAEAVNVKNARFSLIYTRTVHVCKFTISLCHDFTINSSRKSREINCLTISGY